MLQMDIVSLHHKTISIPVFFRVLAVHGLFALLKIIFIVFGRTSLFFEEAQYWLWSQHLALSYYSKPPLIAYVNFVSTGLLGDTELAIRINAVLSGFIIGIIVYLLASEILRDQKKAFLSSVLLIAFPYFWIISYFFTTDSLVTLFWTWAIYSVYKALQDRPVYWIWTGIAVGLGFLSKYTMFFFWPLVFVYLVIYRRQEFLRPNIYLSVFLSMLFMLPIVYWNAVNDWVTVRHVWALASGNASGSDPFSITESLKYFAEYVGGQLLLVLLPLLGLIILSLKRQRRIIIRPVDVLIIGPIAFILLFFGALSIVTHVEVNWTFFAMPVLSIIMVRYGLAYAAYRGQLTVIPVLMVIFFSLPIIAHYTAMPSELNPMKRVIGWEALSSDVRQIIETYEEEPVIIADSYQMASMLTFYLPDHPFVHDFSPGKRMNQFDIWEDNCSETDGIVIYIRRYTAKADSLDEYFGDKLFEAELGRPVSNTEVIPVTVSAHVGFHPKRKNRKERF